VPIRFYCPFCGQLLGVSRRKAGAAVRCPRCLGEVGVPGGGGGRPPAQADLPAASAEVVLSARQVAVLALLLLLLVGLAFLAGLLIGALS